MDPLLHVHEGQAVDTEPEGACDAGEDATGDHGTVGNVVLHTRVICGNHAVHTRNGVSLPSWVEGVADAAMIGIAALREVIPRATGHVVLTSRVVLTCHPPVRQMSDVVLLPPSHISVDAVRDGVPVVLSLAHRPFSTMLVMCDALARQLGHCGNGWARDTIEWLSNFHHLCVEAMGVVIESDSGACPDCYSEIPCASDLPINQVRNFERLAGAESVAVKKGSKLVLCKVPISAGGGELFCDESRMTQELFSGDDPMAGVAPLLISRSARRRSNARETHRRSIALVREAFPRAVQFALDACSGTNPDVDSILKTLSGRVVGVFDRTNVDYMACVDPNGSDTPFVEILFLIKRAHF